MKSFCQTTGILIMTSMAVLVALEFQAAEANAPATLRLILPRDYQVHQRATRAAGTIVVAGSLAKASAQPAMLEARLVGERFTCIPTPTLAIILEPSRSR